VQDALAPAPGASSSDAPPSDAAPTSGSAAPTSESAAPTTPAAPAAPPATGQNPAADVGGACAYDAAKAQEALDAGEPPTKNG